MERRLAAILAADVVGYSRLMGADEAGTLARLKTLRAELIDPRIAEHHGNVFKTTGDGVLVEFPSVVEAVLCAVEIQRAVVERNADIPRDRRITFRVGVNLGDVIADDDDVFGDGVNVAARLEGLAEPGGICISRTVFDHVKNKVELGFANLGEQKVKNIAEPVSVYRVLIDPDAAGTVLGEKRVRTVRWQLAAVAVALLVGATAVVVWMRPWAPAVEVASEERMAFPLPEKPSIAVLPFANLSGEAEQAYFADGMTDDLITDLSKISGLFVIARNSVFTYKGTPVKVQRVAEELGVRYVLEGSVRRAGGRVRINAQLIDAISGHHLWAERYDRDYTDIFSLQDEVIAKIVSALAVELTDAEETRLARKPTENLEAYDSYLRAEIGRHGYGGALRGGSMMLYKKAIELDPGFAEAYAGMATAALDVWRFSEYDVLPGPVARKRAYESASRALALDPVNARAHSVLGLLLTVEGRHDEAIETVRKAVALDPNHAEAYTYLASVFTYAGRHAEALVAMETALRQNPKPPPYYLADLGWVLFFNRQYERAIGPLEQARDAGVDYLETLASVYAQLGRLEEARATVGKIRVQFGFANLAYFRVLYGHHKRGEDLEHRLESLRKAGVPEWPSSYQGRMEDRLDGRAIAALAFGRTWIGQTWRRGPFMKAFSADGRLAHRGAATMFTGTASVEGDMLCEQFETFLMGRKYCGYVYLNPEGTPENNDEYVYVNVFTANFFSVQE